MKVYGCSLPRFTDYFRGKLQYKTTMITAAAARMTRSSRSNSNNRNSRNISSNSSNSNTKSNPALSVSII